MFVNLCRLLAGKTDVDAQAWTPDIDVSIKEPRATILIPDNKTRYLAEISEQGRAINNRIEEQLCDAANTAQHCYEALRAIDDPALPNVFEGLLTRVAG